MSASREKKKRQEQQASVSKPVEEKKTPRWKVAVYSVIGVLFVIAFVLVLLLNSSFFAKHSTAVTVGEHKISPAMMNIYYTSSYSNFYSQYESYISYFFDTSTPLDEQYVDESTGETWADYFMNSAEDSLTWAYTMYDLAVQEGYTLSSEEQSSIDASITSLKEAASSNGFSSVNGYLAAYYGKGVTTKLYSEFLEVQYLASDYYSDKVASFEFTDDEKFSFYADNADTYDTVSLDYCRVSGAPDTVVDEDGNEIEATEEETEAAMEAGREKANEIAAGGAEAMSENDVNALEDYSKNYLSYVLPSEVGDWAYSTDRSEGDIEVFESGQAFYVVRFTGRNNHDYLTRNARILTVSPETVETITDADGNTDTEATNAAQEQAYQDAKDEAKDIFEEWEDGEMTEESFLSLIETYSDDTSTTEGLYESIHKNQFSDTLIDWLYDSKRKEGDCELFTDSNTCYIVYYLSEGENYQLTLVADDIITDAYNTWYEDVSSGYTAQEKSFGLRFVNTR